MLAGWPIFIDRPLVKSDDPIQGDVIICLGGGLTNNNFPTAAGLDRVYTAVQLFYDNYASKIYFTGGGAQNISEAEIYAEVAQWLGCPKEAIVIEFQASRTADHPLDILENKKYLINQNSPLNIVTSPLHSRRTYLCFKKSGFRNFRIITSYSSKKENSSFVRALKKSQFENFRPILGKKQDVFLKLKLKTEYFLDAVREWAAIGWYKIKGYI